MGNFRKKFTPTNANKYRCESDSHRGKTESKKVKVENLSPQKVKNGERFTFKVKLATQNIVLLQ